MSTRLGEKNVAIKKLEENRKWRFYFFKILIFQEKKKTQRTTEGFKSQTHFPSQKSWKNNSQLISPPDAQDLTQMNYLLVMLAQCGPRGSLT